MGDFDWSKGNHIAAAILFPMALVGLASNLTVVVFLNSMPSLKNSFGSLTLSQAIVDSVHQLLLGFYLAPTIYYQHPDLYSVSHHFGFATLLAYQICCFSHVCISINRFVAVSAPLVYSKLFSPTNTRIIIVTSWILAIAVLVYELQIVDCWFYLPANTWIYTFKDNPACTTVKWFGDFSLNCTSVVIVAVLDIASIARLHCFNTDAASVLRRSRQIVLVYQAALQGILFITELITYFLLSSYARNKWEAFALTTISWCLVNGMDGIIVLVCNRDFRRQLKKVFTCACAASHTSVGNLAQRTDGGANTTNTLRSTTAASTTGTSSSAVVAIYRV